LKSNSTQGVKEYKKKNNQTGTMESSTGSLYELP